jgi:hypothetical protein
MEAYMKQQRAKRATVGLYLYPTTRNKLNKLRADLTYKRGDIVTLDDTVNILLNHFLTTSNEVAEREYA